METRAKVKLERKTEIQARKPQLRPTYYVLTEWMATVRPRLQKKPSRNGVLLDDKTFSYAVRSLPFLAV